MLPGWLGSYGRVLIHSVLEGRDSENLIKPLLKIHCNQRLSSA